MKKINLDILSSQYRIFEYRALYAKVMALIEGGSIKPVKASGTNGKSPALYKEYWIIEEKQDMSGCLDELNYEIVPSISTIWDRLTAIRPSPSGEGGQDVETTASGLGRAGGYVPAKAQ
ncbi:MAG: hypothetical protein K1W36_18195 [Lachnospiraceae bacterium]